MISNDYKDMLLALSAENVKRIDIITQISGVTFSDAWPRSVAMEWEGLSIRVLSLQDLLANKRASGRPKDLLDVQLLERLIADKK